MRKSGVYERKHAYSLQTCGRYYRIYSNVMRTFFGQITPRKLGCALDLIANLKNTADHAVVRPR
jgi:hypothetical protein